MKAVRFHGYGDIDVLDVEEVPDPVPGEGQVLVRVKAAGINPGEAKIRNGTLHEWFPATFPSGEGSDLAGVVERVGPGVGDHVPGEEVIGWTDNRASHAELVLVETANLIQRPPAVPWDVAATLYVAGSTAWAGVRAIGAAPGDVVVVAGAAGGVGGIAVQLARRAGATVIGLASERHHEWLRGHGVLPLSYGDGVADRIRDAAGGKVDALIDLVAPSYVELALDLGVAPDRIDTVTDPTAARRHGVKTDGNAAGATATTLAELAGLVASGDLDIPIAATYPLAEVRAAYRELESGHTRGKIVLHP
jgi:NADPH:quinone reductase-like Zn-dependent oxidoreductase